MHCFSKLFPFIHFLSDGRGRRKVLLDGQPVKAVYCNTLTGIVVHYLNPLRLDPLTNDAELIQSHGKVTVEWRKP